MFNRRQFLQSSALTSLSLLFKNSIAAAPQLTVKDNPVVIATWGPNEKANAAAQLKRLTTKENEIKLQQQLIALKKNRTS